MMKNYNKTNRDQIFDHWNNLKKSLDRNNRTPGFDTGEVWWCNFGQNIGVEVYGKNERFTRPVLVFKKFNRYSFLGVPLTSIHYDDIWHASFNFKGKIETAMLSQIRVFSSARLETRIGKIGIDGLYKVKAGIYNLYIK